jgi:hypothetical protein
MPSPPVGRTAGALFRTISRARSAKSLHPRGMVFDATLHIDGAPHAPSAATLLSTPAEHPAIVRFSRSVGFPPPLPDLFGAAIRLPDVHGPGRHQDFLVVTSVDAPVLHHGFIPVTDAQQAPYSSSLPYHAGDETLLVGLQPVAGSPRPDGENLEERLLRAAATGRLRFAFAIAPVMGRFRPVGELRIGERRPDELNGMPFNPWNTGGGLAPAGWLNGLRRYAYPMSQEGWQDR